MYLPKGAGGWSLHKVTKIQLNVDPTLPVTGMKVAIKNVWILVTGLILLTIWIFEVEEKDNKTPPPPNIAAKIVNTEEADPLFVPHHHINA